MAYTAEGDFLAERNFTNYSVCRENPKIMGANSAGGWADEERSGSDSRRGGMGQVLRYLIVFCIAAVIAVGAVALMMQNRALQSVMLPSGLRVNLCRIASAPPYEYDPRSFWDKIKGRMSKDLRYWFSTTILNPISAGGRDKQLVIFLSTSEALKQTWQVMLSDDRGWSQWDQGLALNRGHNVHHTGFTFVPTMSPRLRLTMRNLAAGSSSTEVAEFVFSNPFYSAGGSRSTKSSEVREVVSGGIKGSALLLASNVASPTRGLQPKVMTSSSLIVRARPGHPSSTLLLFTVKDVSNKLEVDWKPYKLSVGAPGSSTAIPFHGLFSLSTGPGEWAVTIPYNLYTGEGPFKVSIGMIQKGNFSAADLWSVTGTVPSASDISPLGATANLNGTSITLLAFVGADKLSTKETGKLAGVGFETIDGKEIPPCVLKAQTVEGEPLSIGTPEMQYATEYFPSPPGAIKRHRIRNWSVPLIDPALVGAGMSGTTSSISLPTSVTLQIAWPRTATFDFAVEPVLVR